MSDLRFTHEAVAPLIGRLNVEGRSVVVSFRDPDGGPPVASRAFMRETVQDQVGMEARRQAARAVHQTLAGHVASMLGYGPLGSLGRQAVQAAGRAAAPVKRERIFDEEDQRRAVVEAFQLVADRFRWDGQRWRSEALMRSEARPPVERVQTADPARSDGELPPADTFEGVLARARLEDADKRLLARLLAELAAADGEVGERERLLFDAFTDAGLDALDELIGQEPLHAAEIELEGDGADAVMLLGMALAYADLEVRAAEATRLEQLREALGISAPRQAELDALARSYVIGQLYDVAWRGGRMDMLARNEARRAGFRLGLAPDRLDALDQAARARHTR